MDGTDRELRLRARIDALSDRVAELEDERAQLLEQTERLRRRLARKSNALFDARRAREVWRLRATHAHGWRPPKSGSPDRGVQAGAVVADVDDILRPEEGDVCGA